MELCDDKDGQDAGSGGRQHMHTSGRFTACAAEINMTLYTVILQLKIHGEKIQALRLRVSGLESIPSVHPGNDASYIVLLVKDTKMALQSNKLTFWTKVHWAFEGGSASPVRPGPAGPKASRFRPFLPGHDVKHTETPAMLHFAL